MVEKRRNANDIDWQKIENKGSCNEDKAKRMEKNVNVNFPEEREENTDES